jgi:HK97 family phage portal protein
VIVRTLDGLQALTSPAPAWHMSGHSAGGLDLYTGSMSTYAEIYRTQPNIRTCVEFLARNVAQLGLPVFRRVSDTDRVRLADHPLAVLLERPNPGSTRYTLIDATVQDYLTYFNAYWLKIRSTPMALVRLPPAQVHVEGTLQPTAFVWTVNGREQPFAPSEIVHFRGYNPDPHKPLMGLSPLETLRRILAEEAAAGDYRQALWGNASRMEGVWELDKDSPAAKWNDTQKQSWRTQWQEFAGGGSKAGMTAIGPAGGSYKPISYSAKDTEYLGTRKLTREECASAYHIPLPMVGILEHATYSNVREMRKMLYADCLGPTLEMIQAEIERQVGPEFDDAADLYVEFNIAEKLKGSFEEQAQSLSLAIGKPWMKVNEGRALQNLPADDDPSSDEIAAQQGGPAAPAEPGDAPVPFKPTPKPGNPAAVAAVIRQTQARQTAKLAKLPIADRADAFVAQMDRWDQELAADLAPLVGAAQAAREAEVANAETVHRLDREATDAAA